MRTLIGVVILVWIAIGAMAAGQRGYFTNDHAVDCRTTADMGLTFLAGPLNYVGVNPKVTCTAPQPSR